MIKLLGLEYFKIRRKKIWLMMTLFLLVEILWGFMVTSRFIAKNPDDAVWESVIFSLSSLNGLFMPILSAIVVSRICDMEHKGATWKMLVVTNVDRTKLYAAKYLCANSLLLYGIVTQTVLMIAFGIINDFPGALPFNLLIRFIWGTLLTTLAITALQQWISLAFKNQAFALCLGMVGGFLGMTAGLFPAVVRQLLIWSYYLELSPVTLQFDQSTGSHFLIQHAGPGIAVAALMVSVLFYIAGSIHIARKEI